MGVQVKSREDTRGQWGQHFKEYILKPPHLFVYCKDYFITGILCFNIQMSHHFIRDVLMCSLLQSIQQNIGYNEVKEISIYIFKIFSSSIVCAHAHARGWSLAQSGSSLPPCCSFLTGSDGHVAPSAGRM